MVKISNQHLLHKIHFLEKQIAYMDFRYIIILY